MTKIDTSPHVSNQGDTGPKTDTPLDERPAKRRRIDSPNTFAVSANSGLPTSSPTATFTPGARPGVRQEAASLNPGPTSVETLQPTELDNARDPENRPPPALPVRPWAYAPRPPRLQDTTSAERVRKEAPVPNTPDKLETPDIAPKFRHGTLGGFFPWVGKHPEDVLSAEHVKGGYFDKGPNPLDKELSTAKAPLYNAFKNKSGLEYLSALFSLALEAKNKHGGISSSSSFKPPPRVTLTETKKRAWLADLASADVPLRRLSRTIPQNIRGQMLLEQCLVNSVPINRALWFAKCVGANEIRTLKRKGTTPAVANTQESKWIKEWTSNVEQFLEALAGRCGQPAWRIDIQYAVRLSTRLYLENLLDRDHYLEWVVKSLSASDLAHVPFWLLLSQIYTKDLARFHRRGNRLAEGLVSKLNLACDSDQEILQPLILKLSSHLRELFILQPQCFLMPDKWPECEAALQHALSTGSTSGQQLLEDIRRANIRALGHTRSPDGKTSPHQAIIRLLDSLHPPYDIRSLIEECQRACQDDILVATTVLEWSTSQFRSGQARIYLAVRILRRFHKVGLDIESILFNFVATNATGNGSSGVSVDAFKHVIGELSRSRTFSTSRYIQWLGTRGALQGTCFTLDKDGQPGDHRIQDCTDPFQLLTEISLGHLETHVVSLRNTMLVRAGFDVEQERSIVRDCKSTLTKRLALVDTGLEAQTTGGDGSTTDLSKWPWTMKYEIAHWLREQASIFYDPSVRDEKRSASGINGLNATQFCRLRNCLEEIGDLAVLADVLKMVLATPSEEVRALVVDTIARHLPVLSAIGAFETLYQRACQSYLALRATRPAVLHLASSLLSLCTECPNKTLPTKTLQRDFVKGDRRAAAAAYSPFSDGIAESLQHAGEMFIEEFEAILQSEPNMNDQTTSQLFGLLTGRIAKGMKDADFAQTCPVMCQLLARLRLRRPRQCNLLIPSWISQLLSEARSEPGHVLLINLVSERCAEFGTLIECARKVIQISPNAVRDQIRALFAQNKSPVNPASQYRFNTSRLRYLQSRPLAVVDILTEITPDGENLIGESTWSELLGNLVLKPESVEALSSSATTLLLVRLKSMLVAHEQSGSSDLNEITCLVQRANDFSLPLCRLWLSLSAKEQQVDAARMQDEMAQAFLSVAIQAPDARNVAPGSAWSELLRAASPQVAAKVRHEAEETFFTSLPAYLQSKAPVPSATTDDPELTARYLEVISGACHDTAGQPSAGISARLLEKASLSLKCLSNAAKDSLLPSTPSTGVPMTPIAATTPTAQFSIETPAHLFNYVRLLVRMICLQRAAFAPVPPPSSAFTSAPPVPASHSSLTKQVQQDLIMLLLRLVSLALHPALNASPQPPGLSTVQRDDLVSFILDTVATLSDNLTEEGRALCLRFLKEKMTDSRLQFVFGSVNAQGSALCPEVGEGLLLVRDLSQSSTATALILGGVIPPPPPARSPPRRRVWHPRLRRPEEL